MTSASTHRTLLQAICNWNVYRAELPSSNETETRLFDRAPTRHQRSIRRHRPAWDPPNATPLEEIPRLKYNLYYGVDGGAITNLIGTTTNRTYTVTNMAPANYQIVARAINIWGKESVPGNVLTLPANVTPGAPMTLKGTFKGEFTIEIR